MWGGFDLGAIFVMPNHQAGLPLHARPPHPWSAARTRAV